MQRFNTRQLKVFPVCSARRNVVTARFQVNSTDLQVLREVVEQNDLQQQLLSSDNVGWKIQRQEEIPEHGELQKDHMETVELPIRCKQSQLIRSLTK